jgi:hypothetical protein
MTAGHSRLINIDSKQSEVSLENKKSPKGHYILLTAKNRMEFDIQNRINITKSITHKSNNNSEKTQPTDSRLCYILLMPIVAPFGSHNRK